MLATSLLACTSLVVPLSRPVEAAASRGLAGLAPVAGRRSLLAVFPVLVGFASTLPVLAEEGELAKQGAMGGRPSSLGSAGISAYEQLKLDKALDDLKEPAAIASANIKPTIDLLLTSTLPKVRDAKLDAIDTEKITVATTSLLGLATSDGSLQTRAWLDLDPLAMGSVCLSASATTTQG